MEFIYENPSTIEIPSEAVESDIYASPISSDTPSCISPQRAESQHIPNQPRLSNEKSNIRPSSISASTPGLLGWQSLQDDEDIQNGPRDTSGETPLRDSFRNSIAALSPQSLTNSSRNQHWPPADKSEALLFRHFVAKLSLWVCFDPPISSDLFHQHDRSLTTHSLTTGINRTPSPLW